MIIIVQKDYNRVYLNEKSVASVYHDINTKEATIVFTNWNVAQYPNVKEIIFD